MRVTTIPFSRTPTTATMTKAVLPDVGFFAYVEEKSGVFGEVDEAQNVHRES